MFPTSEITQEFCLKVSKEFSVALLHQPFKAISMVAITTFNCMLGGVLVGCTVISGAIAGYGLSYLATRYDIKWLAILTTPDALTPLFQLVNIVFYIVLPSAVLLSAPAAMIFFGRDVQLQHPMKEIPDSN